MKRTSIPLYIDYLVSELVNIFYIFVVWNYSSQVAIQ